MTRYCSIILCAAVAALVALGLVMLTSTGAWVKGVSPYHFLINQSIMLGVGLVLAIAAAHVDIGILRRWAPWLMLGACVLLAFCYLPVVGVEIYGSKRWIKLPLIGQFQPSEASRIVVVICLAAWFARWQTEVHTFWRGFVLPGVIVGIPILLIAGETDVGTALSLSVTVGAIMYCVGTRLRYLLPAALLAMSGAWWYVSNNANRWSRIEAWMDLENPVHQLDKGMQQWRALLALGNGGPEGVGLGNGVEKFGTLTFAHIDFIFPVIGEELGLRVTLLVVACYVLIALAGTGIALSAKNLYYRCVAIGITCIIVVPAMVNIGVTTAVLPNDGLPLPFVSYGGTSLIFSLAAVGVLIGIHRRSYVKMHREYPLAPETRLALKL